MENLYRVVINGRVNSKKYDFKTAYKLAYGAARKAYSEGKEFTINITDSQFHTLYRFETYYVFDDKFHKPFFHLTLHDVLRDFYDEDTVLVTDSIWYYPTAIYRYNN